MISLKFYRTWSLGSSSLDGRNDWRLLYEPMSVDYPLILSKLLDLLFPSVRVDPETKILLLFLVLICLNLEFSGDLSIKARPSG